VLWFFVAGRGGLLLDPDRRGARHHEQQTERHPRLHGAILDQVSSRRMDALVFLLAAQLTGSAPSAACTSATRACTEWMPLGAGPARSLIYRTYSLDTPNDRIRRALVLVHGTGRNA